MEFQRDLVNEIEAYNENENLYFFSEFRLILLGRITILPEVPEHVHFMRKHIRLSLG